MGAVKKLGRKPRLDTQLSPGKATIISTWQKEQTKMILARWYKSWDFVGSTPWQVFLLILWLDFKLTFHQWTSTVIAEEILTSVIYHLSMLNGKTRPCIFKLTTCSHFICCQFSDSTIIVANYIVPILGFPPGPMRPVGFLLESLEVIQNYSGFQHKPGDERTSWQMHDGPSIGNDRGAW